MGAATLVVKASGMVKEMVVAWRFGTSDELDAFTVALIVPFYLLHTVVTPLQSTFLPVYVLVEYRDGSKAAAQLFSNSILWLLGVFTCITAGMVLGGPIYLPYLASGFSPAKLSLSFHLLCLLAPMMLLVGTSFFVSGILNVKNQFAITAAAPLITTALTIFLLVWAKSIGIYGMALAMTVGAGIELIFLAILLSRQGVSLSPRWGLLPPPLKQVFRSSLSLMVSNLLMTGTNLAGIALAARLPTGSVSSLGYANKVTSLTLGVIATSLSTVATPYLSKLSSHGDWKQLKSSFQQLLGGSLLVTVPLTISLMLMAKPLIRFLFGQGAFAIDDVEIVAEVLFYLAMQIPFHVSNVLAARLFLALRVPQAILYVSLGSLLIYLISAHFLSAQLGLVGIAISFDIIYFFSSLALYLLAIRKFKKLLA